MKLSRDALRVQCVRWARCGWWAAITPDPPTVSVLPVREHLEAALGLLSGDVTDGQWIGKPVGTTYVCIPAAQLEQVRGHLYQVLHAR